MTLRSSTVKGKRGNLHARITYRSYKVVQTKTNVQMQVRNNLDRCSSMLIVNFTIKNYLHVLAKLCTVLASRVRCEKFALRVHFAFSMTTVSGLRSA